jgi:hypothetical protein
MNPHAKYNTLKYHKKQINLFNGREEIIILGDGIVEGMKSTEDVSVNGIEHDGISQGLWRCKNKFFDYLDNPRFIFLFYGNEDIKNNSAEECYNGMLCLVNIVNKKLPNVNIVVGVTNNEDENEEIETRSVEYNRMLVDDIEGKLANMNACVLVHTRKYYCSEKENYKLLFKNITDFLGFAMFH